MLENERLVEKVNPILMSVATQATKKVRKGLSVRTPYMKLFEGMVRLKQYNSLIYKRELKERRSNKGV